jgi:Mn2+/Fe2+ NRAMP family transporter
LLSAGTHWVKEKFALKIVAISRHKDPVKALFWAAVINGLLAPFLLIGILIVVSDREIMRGEPSSRLSRIVVSITALAMFGAAIAMFVL